MYSKTTRVLALSTLLLLQVDQGLADTEGYCRQRYLNANPVDFGGAVQRFVAPQSKSVAPPKPSGTPMALPPAPPPPVAEAAFAATRESRVVRAEAPLEERLVTPDAMGMNQDAYPEAESNPIKRTTEHPVSTFSADVDTAAYAVVRRHLKDQERMPPADAVRVEELINAFTYQYPSSAGLDQPFTPDIALFPSPWNPHHELLRIGIQAYALSEAERPPANLVFLLDVSGSMGQTDKLPLAKTAICMLTHELKEDDHIALVVYAGAAGVVLEPTSVKDKSKILDAMDRLNAGGSTAGGQGIELAYSLAEAHFQQGAANRILLATDGDFNVGIANPRHLQDYVARKRDSGVFLTVLGFGMGNYKDNMMQALAQNGNGVAAYIDSVEEAHKVLVRGLTGSIITVARDVKFQIEFNPAQVAEYRLIGYETRMLKREDFSNDRVDAGDVGSGHQVTAIYELTPSDSADQAMEPLRYGAKPPAQTDTSDELAHLRIRFKPPGKDQSQLIERPIQPSEKVANSADVTADARFAAAVAWFAQALRNDPHVERDWRAIAELANGALGEDPYYERAGLVELVRKAERISARE